jgi:membrane protein YdbS with pleckstrin-like domain
MPKRKVVPYKREQSKSTWHTYSLQELQPERFIRVAAGILAGRMTVVPVMRVPDYLR